MPERSFNGSIPLKDRYNHPHQRFIALPVCHTTLFTIKSIPLYGPHTLPVIGLCKR
jgi:hypothetical protein